jgi:hypothetical protein
LLHAKRKNLKLQLNDKAVPPILLFAVLVSFGLLIPRLGFYWDDWPVVYMTHTQGINGFWAFYQFDRPFSAWTYILLTPILGTHSIAWYIFVMDLRWAAVSIWLVLRQIWPAKHHQVFWIALLFAECPLFPLQIENFYTRFQSRRRFMLVPETVRWLEKNRTLLFRLLQYHSTQAVHLDGFFFESIAFR